MLLKITNIITALFLIAIACTLAKNAFAQSSRIYMAGYLGLSKLSDADMSSPSVSGQARYDNNMSFAGALGLRLNYNLRIEAEASYASNNFARLDNIELGGDISRTSIMLNGYYDFDVPWDIRPFLSAGIGMHRFKGDIRSSSIANDTGDAAALGWSMGGGLKYRISDDMAITGSYRYLGSTNIDIGTYDIEYTNHEFRIGIEYDLH